jgi:hypothetical protein
MQQTKQNKKCHLCGGNGYVLKKQKVSREFDACPVCAKEAEFQYREQTNYSIINNT